MDTITKTIIVKDASKMAMIIDHHAFGNKCDDSVFPKRSVTALLSENEQFECEDIIAEAKDLLFACEGGEAEITLPAAMRKVFQLFNRVEYPEEMFEDEYEFV